MFVDIDRNMIGALARKYRIRMAVLFGSAVRGEMHEHSDVDIGVVLDDEVTDERRLGLYGEIGAAVRSRAVDLTILNHADPLLLFHAVRDAELLFGNPEDLADLQALAFRQYCDHRKYLEMERAYARELTQRVST